MTSFHKIAIFTTALILALCLGSCRTKKANTINENISLTTKQLDKDLTTLQNLKDSNYPSLSHLFRVCDSMLVNTQKNEIEKYFTSLSYANGYLAQFDDIYPIIKEKINYSKKQLSSLSSDIESHYINDSLAAIYYEDEVLVADTIHEQIKYFSDRFKKMEQELRKAEKELKR